MLRRMSLMAGMAAPSAGGVAIGGGVAPRREMLDLALDIAEQRAGADAEEIRQKPGLAHLLLHQGKPSERVLRTAEPTRRLEAHPSAGLVLILAERPQHDQADGQGRVHLLLPGR